MVPGQRQKQLTKTSIVWTTHIFLLFHKFGGPSPPPLALPLTTPLPSTDPRGREATQKVEKNQLTQKSGRGKQIVDVESPRTAIKQIFQWGNFFCEQAWKVNFQAQVISHFYSIQVSAAHFLHHISLKFLQSSIARKCALYKCFFIFQHQKPRSKQTWAIQYWVFEKYCYCIVKGLSKYWY